MTTIRRLAALVTASALVLGAAGAALSVVGPDAVDDAYEVAEDGSLDVSAPGVLGNDALTEGMTVCFVPGDVSHLHGVSGFTSDGGFGYQPAADYNGSGDENYFTYTISEVADGETCPVAPTDTATVRVTVTPVNDPPTAAADSFSVVKNVTLNVAAPGVLDNDHDIDGDSLAAVKVSNPSHGVVILAADGSFGYTPTTGYVGPDAFSYYASDGSPDHSQTRVVSLTVTAIPPIATPTPIPTPSPTLTPIQTPQETIAEPTSTPEETPSPEPSPSAAETLAASASPAPSPSPGSSEAPAPVDEGGGGVSLPVLLVIVLFVLLAGFGAALYVPKWLATQRGEPPDVD